MFLTRHQGQWKNEINDLLGQLRVLHCSFDVLLPTHLPPFVSVTATVLVFVWVPPPHEWVQAPMLHRPHWQSIATARCKVGDIKSFLCAYCQEYYPGNKCTYDKRRTLTSTILARFLAMVPDDLSFPPLSNLTSTLGHCLPISFTTFPCFCKLWAWVLCLTTTLESCRICVYHAPYKKHNSTNSYNIERTSFIM